MRKIKFVVKDDNREERLRYIPGYSFPSMFKIKKIELCTASENMYPIPIKCSFEELNCNDEQRLQWRIEEFGEWAYECEDYPLCYIVQEIPTYIPAKPSDKIQERLYRYSQLVGGQYYDSWAHENGNEGTCEWFACEGEDEIISKKFAELRKCKREEIVQVIRDEYLTLGIIEDYCNDGCYNMWIWNEHKECSREKISSSRILYGHYMDHEWHAFDDNIRNELKKKLIENNTICELRVFCRNERESKYPFDIYTVAKYFYPSFSLAKAAIPGLVKEYATKEWLNVYRYVIYTLAQNKEISDMNKDAEDIAVYLPDGSLWIRTGTKGVIRKGEVYEYIDGANSVHRCMIENDSRNDDICDHLILNCDYTHGWSHITEIMPCTFPVSEPYVDALKSKLDRYDEVERGELKAIRGVPYEVESKYDEDMSDYLYIPTSFSGFKYDMFFDCNAAYRKNMHPMWFYVAHPVGDKTVLLPITVSSDITLMWEEYEHLMYDLSVTEGLIDFIIFNLQDIMTLADYQCTPEYFLWNMMKMANLSNLTLENEECNDL